MTRRKPPPAGRKQVIDLTLSEIGMPDIELESAEIPIDVVERAEQTDAVIDALTFADANMAAGETKMSKREAYEQAKKAIEPLIALLRKLDRPGDCHLADFLDRYSIARPPIRPRTPSYQGYSDIEWRLLRASWAVKAGMTPKQAADYYKLDPRALKKKLEGRRGSSRLFAKRQRSHQDD